jgi:hypothetical protein
MKKQSLKNAFKGCVDGQNSNAFSGLVNRLKNAQKKDEEMVSLKTLIEVISELDNEWETDIKDYIKIEN